MTRTDGSGAVPIGVLDGPVAALRADRLAAAVEPVPREPGAGSGPVRDSAALRHGTAVAGVLGAARGSGAPGSARGVRCSCAPCSPRTASGRPPPNWPAASTSAGCAAPG
ncbi:hypothetical protein ACFQ60_13750 [Streptomyces zhihengii]